MMSKKNLIPLPSASASKLKSNVLHFVFINNLWFSDDDGDFVEERRYPTKDNKINEAVKKFISSDKLHYLVESIVYDYKLINYYFKDNLLHIIVDTEKNISMKELADKLYDIDIEGNAPDLWMEGDISVTDNIGFIPKIYRLFYVLGDTEREIELIKIPKSNGYY